MKQLWTRKDRWDLFNPQQSGFRYVSGYPESYLPYQRQYGTLNEEELLQLIRDAKANGWQALDLSCCGLRSLPDELWELSELRMLYLGKAEVLDKKERNHVVLSSKMEGLKNLQALVLYGAYVQITENRPFCLPNLCYVDLCFTGFDQYPPALLIPSLQGISFLCSEASIDEKILQLRELRYLNLGSSDISELPAGIGALKKLEKLNIRNTQISALPESIRELERLTDLNIYRTPLFETLPPEIGRQSAQEIIQYYFGQLSRAPKEFFHEAKLLIVGQGNVGKTCLLKRLIYDTYQDEKSTEGMDIEIWNFPYQEQDYRLNVWDFGGQEIYHATHQFFLTKRSLYLLVWDARAEEEYGRIDYWLKTIQSMADDSPIIIVVNKCDQETGRIRDLDIDTYRKKYPQIQGMVRVSCKDNIGIPQLRRQIMELAVKLPLMETKWFTSWLQVRQKLEALSKEKNYIDYQEYLELCATEEVGPEEARSLIKYLHDLGIVLYYHEDELLQDIVILSSEWGTDAVYKVLDEKDRLLKGRNGILYRKDLRKIWKDTDRYPRDRYHYLMELMNRFQLAFQVTKNTYLVAELLNSKPIEQALSFERENTLFFRYQYSFLPAGIMTRFIVSIHEYLDEVNGVKQCWTKGAYLRHETAYALVRLYDGLDERYVDIRVSGVDPHHRQDLLTKIRMTLGKINSLFSKIEIMEQVPCICSPGCRSMFDYRDLWQAEGKTAYIQCHKSFQNVDIRKLLYGVTPIMSEKDERILIHNIFNAQNNPTITNTNTNENTNTNTITVDIRDAIDDLVGKFEYLKEKVDETDRDFQATAKAVKKLDGCETQRDIKRSGALEQIFDFLEDCNDPNSRIGKALSGVKNATKFIQEMAGQYNKIAKWIPGVPALPFGDS